MSSLPVACAESTWNRIPACGTVRRWRDVLITPISLFTNITETRGSSFAQRPLELVQVEQPFG
jgi:hypothetical protein